MRNQNQPPVASFVASLSGTTYTFDGGGSSDPEDRTLVYDWYTAPPGVTAATMPAASALPSCGAATPIFPGTGQPGNGWACLGTTVVLSKGMPASKWIFLRVTDPGNLQKMSSLPTGTGCLSVSNASRIQTSCGAVP
jgi:hypothetical protein